MAVGGPESLYGNTDVFMTHRVLKDKRRPALQNDLVKHNRTESWYHDIGYSWAVIRDRFARCYPLPRGTVLYGHAHRCNLPYFTINGHDVVMSQFRKPGLTTYIGTVTTVFGSPGDITNRSYFQVNSFPAFNIPATNTDDWRIVFLSGDYQGIERTIASYNFMTQRLRLTGTAGGEKNGKPLPMWDKRAVRVGDQVKLICRHRSGGQLTTLWEMTSRIFRYPFGPSPYNLYKAIRFKYSTVLLPQANTIGDDSTGTENWGINDGDVIQLHWRELQYNFTPELVPVYPYDLFPGGGNAHRLWPSEQHRGAIVSVTPVLLGNYTPPGKVGRYSVPVYVWRIQYTVGPPITYEWPVFYRVKNQQPGFVLELWSQKRSKKKGPIPCVAACPARYGGGRYFRLNGDWIHCNMVGMNGEPIGPRNPIKYHTDAYARMRNWKDGGATPLSRQRVVVKYRRISGYAWNIPVLEG